MSMRKLLDMDAVGRRARERRLQLRLEQEDVAARICRSRPYVSRFENGAVKEPKAPDLLAMAEALDTSFEWLVTGDEGGVDGLMRQIAGRLAGKSPAHQEAALRWLGDSLPYLDRTPVSARN